MSKDTDNKQPELQSDDARKVITALLNIIDRNDDFLSDEDENYIEFAKQYLKEGWM